MPELLQWSIENPRSSIKGKPRHKKQELSRESVLGLVEFKREYRRPPCLVVRAQLRHQRQLLAPSAALHRGPHQ